jgi:transcriptional regulator with XRE-family HTH domain
MAIKIGDKIMSKEQETRKIIGDLLRKFRESRGLSVWKAAQVAETSIGCIQAVEDGETNYTIDTFFKYIRACGLYIYFAESDKKVEPHDFEDLIAKSRTKKQ